jgi:hypothetical protein
MRLHFAMANFPGTARQNAIAFSTATKGYVGTGLDANTTKKDLYEFDPGTQTGLEENPFSLFVSVFPDPVKNTARVKCDGTGCEFTLFDVNGKKVFSSVFTDEFVFDRGSLEAGIYFYSIKQGNKVSKGKLVIQ